MTFTPLARKIAGFVDPAPVKKAYRQPQFDPGILYCFDMAYGYCNPLAGGAVANNSHLKNLAPNGADAVVLFSNADAGSAIVNTPGDKIHFTGTTAAIDLGTTYAMDGVQHSFLVIAWVNPDTGAVSTEQVFMSYGTNDFANIQYLMDYKQSTTTFRGQVGGVGPSVDVGTGWMQLAMAYDKSGHIYIYKNGARIATAGTIPTTVPTPAAGTHEGFGYYGGASTTPLIGTNYTMCPAAARRLLKYDLNLSAASTGLSIANQADAHVLRDWNDNHVRLGL